MATKPPPGLRRCAGLHGAVLFAFWIWKNWGKGSKTPSKKDPAKKNISKTQKTIHQNHVDLFWRHLLELLGCTPEIYWETRWDQRTKKTDGWPSCSMWSAMAIKRVCAPFGIHSGSFWNPRSFYSRCTCFFEWHLLKFGAPNFFDILNKSFGSANRAG